MLDDKTVVFKIGGSLIDFPGLGGKIEKLLKNNKISQPLIISGGGETANLVREWDKIHDLTQEDAHDLAVEAIALNEQLFLKLIPESVLVHDRNEAEEAWSKNRIPVLNCTQFLKTEEAKHPSSKLPHHWGVTSDSIAAWIAIHWPASGLVLVKSVSIHSMDLHDQSEFVDPDFIKYVPKLENIGWCNLRSSNPELFFMNDQKKD